jgi:hypothetical protein
VSIRFHGNFKAVVQCEVNEHCHHQRMVRLGSGSFLDFFTNDFTEKFFKGLIFLLSVSPKSVI